MIAEWTVIACSASLQFGKRHPALGHLMQSALRQIRVPADEVEISPEFPDRAQRRSVPAVEIGDLLEREIFEREPRADVERRLIEVGDEELSLSRVSHDQREAAPRPFGIERTRVVPGAEKPEDFARE